MGKLRPREESPHSKIVARLGAGPWAALLTWTPVLLPSPSPTGYADHMGITRFRRRFQVLDPLLTKKLMLVTEGIDERKVCRAGHQRGCKPWMLLFHRGLPQGESGPAGIGEPGLGGKDEGGVSLAQTLALDVTPCHVTEDATHPRIALLKPCVRKCRKRIRVRRRACPSRQGPS